MNYSKAEMPETAAKGVQPLKQINGKLYFPKEVNTSG
jgi:hypothetical protein